MTTPTTAGKLAEQPMPTPNGTTPIWELVKADMDERDRLGIERYGTTLQANNGRDSLLDAYHEALDLCVYLRQHMVERDALKAEVERLTPKFERGAGWVCDGDTMMSGEAVLKLVATLRARVATLEAALKPLAPLANINTSHDWTIADDTLVEVRVCSSAAVPYPLSQWLKVGDLRTAARLLLPPVAGQPTEGPK